MKAYRVIVGILALLALLFVNSTNSALAQQRGGRRGVLASLTEEQRVQIRELIKSMRESESAPEDIRVAVREKLKEWGIELPDRRGPRPRPGRNLRAKLTEEQRAELGELVRSMKESGASWREIRAAVGEKLKEWGIRPPKRPGRGLRAKLTEEQRAAIREKVRELRETGASREEIRAAVREMLEGWGIKPPGSADQGTASKAVPTGVSYSYPNPFNPVTTIAYDLPEPSDVKLRIYSVTGQEVATLVSDHQQPGHYEVTWDASGFANGVYIYRLEAGQLMETGRMVLLK